jgi:hypothetical protein
MDFGFVSDLAIVSQTIKLGDVHPGLKLYLDFNERFTTPDLLLWTIVPDVHAEHQPLPLN